MRTYLVVPRRRNWPGSDLEGPALACGDQSSMLVVRHLLLDFGMPNNILEMLLEILGCIRSTVEVLVKSAGLHSGFSSTHHHSAFTDLHDASK